MLDYRNLISENAEESNGFIYPDWQKLSEIIDKNYPEEQLSLIYNGLAKEWLRGLKNCLDGDFTIYESTNFFMLCNEETHTCKNLIDACERSLKTILEQFAGALSDSGFGKHVLMVFNDIEQYERYTSIFSTSNEPPMSGGMCIHSGYTHIVLPLISSYETPARIIAHELTHALLAEYEIPNWLNEALAMRMEDLEVGYDGLNLDEESYRKHEQYWNEETIQDFWSGNVWGKDSTGFELSYDLARILWKKIAVDLNANKEEIVELIQTLEWEDSGNAAIKKIFDHSLGDLVADFLGDGNWEPNTDAIEKQKKLHLNMQQWIEEVQPLLSIDYDDLLLSKVSSLQPSEKLEQLFIMLDVQSVNELIEITAELVYINHDLFCEVEYELMTKLCTLNLFMLYQERLSEIGDLMFIFRHGKIIHGLMDGNKCILTIEIEHLAGMVNAEFRFFTVALFDFGSFSYCPWDDQNKEQQKLSLEEFISLQPEITGSEMIIGRVRISTEFESEYQTESANHNRGDFSFHASDVRVTDPEGKEWGIEALQNLENEYWAGE